MRRHPRLAVLAGWAVASAALAAVFLLYTQPTMLVTLAGQLWSCVN
ncbi:MULTISPECIES: hypothetical protein [Ramlibacter]|uniref:Uncharacterized protein n=1 Tax=Ramlibacter aquaticus TaxID=2780094 RepID=A0ABR9SJF2_9BURK|nr:MULTISPECIES: hypothetical protein [Ramlibacter]MBE7942284.1 hypothetical protein [Ramlibacter aquaticus]